MHDVVRTGPLYDDAVKLLQQYRRLMSARLSKVKTRRVLREKQLERLSEKIAERLSELSTMELQALDCWKDGIERGFYEVDVDALMERPYRSIRRVHRWTEEYDVEEQRQHEREAQNSANNANTASAERLRKFLYDLDRETY